MGLPTPTVRALARALRLSRSTVSNALRGEGRVAPATRQRVRQAADEAGYRHNPLAATLMSALRRSRRSTFRGVLASVEIDEPDRAPHGPFHLELIKGARIRAGELGFNLEKFVVNRAGLTVQRLSSILQSRGIHGVLLLPSWRPLDFSQLDWTHAAGVYTDYARHLPTLNAVCSDHYRSMIALLGWLAARGYRRPGLCLERERDERIQCRQSAAFHAFHKGPMRDRPVPPLIVPALSRDGFEPWFERYKPDIVLSHFTEIIGWMENCGAKLPATHGFASLNVLYKKRPCAGLDLQPRRIGMHAIESLVAQLQRNERGIPEWPTTTTIQARWVNGPTVREPQKLPPR